MSLKTDPRRAAQVGAALYQAFHGDGVLGAVSMPGAILPDTVERGSVEHLHFITLTVAIDYMRDADALWAASRKTIEPGTASTSVARSFSSAAIRSVCGLNCVLLGAWTCWR